MKKNEIKVGGLYQAKVNGKVVTVRVDKIRDTVTGNGLRGLKDSVAYDVTNLSTGRQTTFRSAQKFREEVKPGKTLTSLDYRAGDDPEMIIEEQEGRQGSDPSPAGVAQNVVPSGPAPTEEGKQGADPTLSHHGLKTPLQDIRISEDLPTSTVAAVGSVAPKDGVIAKETPRTSGLYGRLSQKPQDTAPHVIVEARAGTGKTTTLVAGLQVLRGLQPTDAGGNPITPSPQQQAVWDAIALSKGHAHTVCFCAFNKAIAEELKTRVPGDCDAMTLHSLGFRAVRKVFGNLGPPNSYRVQDIISEILERDIRDLRKDKMVVLQATEKLVGLCKMNLIGQYGEEPANVGTLITWEEELSSLASHYDVDLNGQGDEVFALVPKVLERCKDVTRDRCLDFGDMIWLPVVLNLPVFRYDLLLIDEAQDLNRCQQALAKKAGKRLILCGDPKQAIYGFAGADCESMPRMAKELAEDGCRDGNVFTPSRGCITLPLTVTRRCGKAIVAEAQKIVTDFEAHESNPDGVISEAKYPTKGKGENGRELPWVETYCALVLEGDFILCRVNAPLVSQCFRFIKRGVKANILGRDVGQGLINLVKKVCEETDPATRLIEKVESWLEGETRKEQAKKFPSEAKLIVLQDRADCLFCFTEGAGTVADVLRKIEAVFTDDRNSPGIRLSSIHKAKGLEASRVFFLMPEGAGCPHPMARTAWQQEQEMNLKYVAITRAREELIFVS